MSKDKSVQGQDVDLAHHEGVGKVEAFFEKILFSRRPLVLVFFAVMSVIMLWQAALLKPDASFQKMVPASHPFIANYLKFENELRPLGNVLRVTVENTEGDIYDAEYLEVLKKISDEVFYIPGVDRGNMKSLWTPNVMWREVTEDGLRLGPIIGQGFGGSPEELVKVRENVARSGRIGSLVANNERSSVILAPLLEVDPETGEKLEYGKLGQKLEEQVRKQYQTKKIQIHITGFAKVVGDLIDGAKGIVLFFAMTFVMTIILLYGYSRCWRSTFATVFCCSLAVIWQLGTVRMLGFGMDPYAILVPFLTFAIGVSHAVQNIRTMAAERYAGRSTMDSAKATFRLLFLPGTIALLCDAVGFSTLLIIDIGVIRELAISASVGVAVIIFTKMFLLPVLMSYTDVSKSCLAQVAKQANSPHTLARKISGFAEPEKAKKLLLITLAATVVGFVISRDLKIGDLNPGAPELRPTSQYNKDVAFLTANYSTSSDVFVVMVTTPVGECGSYPVASAVDRFQGEMENIAGVESSVSLFTVMKAIISANNGGNPKWNAITRDRFVANGAHRNIPTELYNPECSMTPVILFLSDHKAETLTRVVKAINTFAAENDTDDVKFIMGAGNSGIEAATNIVVHKADRIMLILVFAIVGLLVWWEFKSLKVTICLMLPLYVTTVLCEALMVALGLGVKVATLPVVALGVGIGVDYGIYIYNRLEGFLEEGMPLKEAYFETLKTTGVAVALTGVTLALGTITWVMSAIKFQADMGLLLTFMFLWNMIGAIIMIPALITVLKVAK